MKKILYGVVAAVMTANLFAATAGAYTADSLKGNMRDVTQMKLYSQKQGEDFNDRQLNGMQLSNIHADSFASEYVEESTGDYSLQFTAKKALTNHGDTYFDMLSMGSANKSSFSPYATADESRFTGRPVQMDLYIDIYAGQITGGVTQRMTGNTDGDFKGDNIKLMSAGGVLGNSDLKYEAGKWYTFRTHIDSYARTREIYVKERDIANAQEQLIYRGTAQEAYSHTRWSFAQDTLAEGDYYRLDNMRMEGQYESGAIDEVYIDGVKLAAGESIPAGTQKLSLKFLSNISDIKAKWVNSNGTEADCTAAVEDYSLTSWGGAAKNALYKGGLVSVSIPDLFAGECTLIIGKGSVIDGYATEQDMEIPFNISVTEPVITSPLNGAVIHDDSITLSAVLPEKAESAYFFVDGTKYLPEISNSAAQTTIGLAENGSHTLEFVCFNSDGSSSSAKASFDVDIAASAVIRNVDFGASFSDRCDGGMQKIAAGLSSAGAAIASSTGQVSNQNDLFVCINGEYAKTSVETEADRGEYLKITADAATGNLGNVYLLSEGGYGYSGRIAYSMDMKVSQSVGMSPVVRLYADKNTAGTKTDVSPFGDYDWTKTAIIRDGKIFTSGVSYPVNEWFNLKMVVDTDKETCEVYLNDEYVTSVENVRGSLSAVAMAGRINWRIRMGAGDILAIDNYRVAAEAAPVEIESLSVTGTTVSFKPNITVTADDVKLYVNGLQSTSARVGVTNGEVRILNKFNNDEDVKILFGKGTEAAAATKISGATETQLKAVLPADYVISFKVADADGLYARTLLDEDGRQVVRVENQSAENKTLTAYLAGYSADKLADVDCAEVTLNAGGSDLIALSIDNALSELRTFIWDTGMKPLR